MDSKNKLEACSMDFAVNILRVSEQCKGHYTLINQLERSATSIGANIREARYAHGRATLLPSSKLRSRNAMRRNIGWSFLSVPGCWTARQERGFCMIAAH